MSAAGVQYITESIFSFSCSCLLAYLVNLGLCSTKDLICFSGKNKTVSFLMMDLVRERNAGLGTH